MSQTPKQSHQETAVDVGIGFVMSVGINYAILVWVGAEAHVGTATGMTLIFMAMSYVRRYFTRRFFNWFHDKDRT